MKDESVFKLILYFHVASDLKRSEKWIKAKENNLNFKKQLNLMHAMTQSKDLLGKDKGSKLDTGK